MAGLRILAVDDEEALLQLLKLLLTRQQHEVTIHTHAPAALEWMRSNVGAVDLAIIDLTMPEMPGTELACEVMALDPNLRVLLSSGYPFSVEMMPEDLRPRLGFLGKPFLPRELQASIKTLFP